MNALRNVLQHQSFMGRYTLYELVDSYLVDSLNQLLEKLWPNKSYSFFAPQPFSIERANFTLLKENCKNYKICIKFDGIRFLCVITSLENIPITLLVDRKFRWYIIDQHFPAFVYQKTHILDGELLNTGEFIIHDIFMYNNRSLINLQWIERHRLINDLLQHYVSNSTTPPNTFLLCPKIFYNLDSQLHLAIETLNKYNQDLTTRRADGLIFYPSRQGVFGPLQLFKWKPTELNTIDFIVRTNSKNNTMLDLICSHKGKEKVYCQYPKSEFQTQLQLQENQVYEFTYCAKTHHFRVIKQRTDKPTPNSLYTIGKTQLNVKENITQEDLMKLIQ